MCEKTIVFVTGNQGKLREVKEILQPHISYNLEHVDLDLNEYQGEIDDICKRKCQDAFAQVNRPVVVEDTSLCFNALGGLPGPYVKWFLKKVGPAGLSKMLTGFEDKTGTAVCTFGFANESGHVELFRGETHGTIVDPRGDQGFGWDSCFLPDGSNQTYAEMSSQDKNLISHRKRALVILKDYLSSINK